MGTRRTKQVEGAPLKIAVACHKVSYPTHAEAYVARIRLYAHNKRERSQRGKLDIFVCTSCNGFHIGHNRPWLKGQRKKK